jgi:hypothetical protein
MPVDDQARAYSRAKRDEKDFAPPARHPYLKLGISGRVRIVIEYYGQARRPRQLIRYVEVRNLGQVRHYLDAVRLSVDKARYAYAYARGAAPGSRVAAKTVYRLDHLSEEPLAALLLGLNSCFMQYLAGGADNSSFDRRSAEVDSYKYRFIGLAGSHKVVPDLIMLKAG